MHKKIVSSKALFTFPKRVFFFSFCINLMSGAVKEYVYPSLCNGLSVSPVKHEAINQTEFSMPN